ncbi:MAG TPA: hypothetical protein VMV10_28080 [Pirellulales bacterium]|nr:hypothetical protein [Pirellulales bacterium]
MARANRQDAEAVGSDSFLDVVTNIVGILIILVMVVGIRIKHAPARSQSDWDESQARAELESLSAEAAGLEGDVRKTEVQIRMLGAAAQGQFAERGTLAYLIAEHERELNEARKALDGKTQQAFDLRRARAKADLDFSRVELAASEAKSQAEKAKKPIKIQSRPTPISHEVFGKEIHFRLQGGRIAWVPLEEIAKSCLEDAAERLRNGGQAHGAAGPIDGFVGEYAAMRHDMSGQIIFKMDLEPVYENFGEPVDEALQTTSQFRERLSDYNPRHATVTLWTYADSFGDYSRVKEALYQLGFSVAGRPLMPGWPIGASTNGSHSAAQ